MAAKTEVETAIEALGETTSFVVQAEQLLRQMIDDVKAINEQVRENNATIDRIAGEFDAPGYPVQPRLTLVEGGDGA